MKRLLLASIAAAIISGAAQAQPTTAGDNGFGLAYRGTHHLDRKLTRQFPEGSFPPGHRPTPLQETLARNGAAAVDTQHYNSWLKRNN
ncbi:hypothetical protein [Microvirga splendida]|uniref:DUF4148 domain-containing protein n=1 Tax=Microvirga splendida TaxID=2795727 RepID=A0ABS0Y8S5_9HYPH|nr:hypothetical protein [Microvirga splendida]MBJ6128328.1 hypothetical protein [Microvirga splendida]